MGVCLFLYASVFISERLKWVLHQQMMARLITKFCYSEFVGYYQDTVGNYFFIQNINIANKEVYIRPEMLSQDDDPNCSPSIIRK